MVLGLLSLFIVARVMPPDQTGIYLVGFAISNVAVVLFAVGLPQAFGVRAQEFGRSRLIASASVTSLALSILASLSVWIALRLFWHEGDLFYRGVAAVPLLTAASYLNVMGSSLLRSMLAIRAANLMMVLPSLLFNLLLGAAFLVGYPIDAAAALFAQALPQIGAILFIAFSLFRMADEPWRRPSRGDMKNLLRFGGVVHVGNALKEVMYRATLIIVQVLMGPIGAATYGVVNRILDAIARFVDAICLNIVPFIARSDRDGGRAIMHLTMDFIVAGFIPGVILVSALSIAVVPVVIGPAYAESAVLLRYAVFAAIPLAIWKVLANEAIALVDVRRYLASAASGAIAMTSLSYLLISYQGLFGAVIAMLLAYCVALLVMLGLRNTLRGYVPLVATIAHFKARQKNRSSIW